jgi:hypothetical protein
MISFMFGVLGSIGFWVTIIIVDIVVGSTLLRKIAPKTWEWIETGKHTAYCADFIDYIGSIIIILFNFLFWPIVLLYFLFVFILCRIVGPLLRIGIKRVGTIVPDIELKRRTDGPD